MKLFDESNEPESWKFVRYPVLHPNLADYDLYLTQEVTTISVDGWQTEIIKPKMNVTEIDILIESNKNLLKEIQNIQRLEITFYS